MAVRSAWKRLQKPIWKHTRGFPAVAFKFRDQKLKASVLVSKTPFKSLQQNMIPAGKPLSVTFFSVRTAIILGV